ncbi:MAG: RNA polymerase factor sigma-54 [candidate division KSB1 bacterium]|nr:RNA polymerase factor sigma-54 [candidate division KSB1 bacterium]MDZ7319672.1 RNA polymerase factor sigma-54 [candidate division KSB1 bacterium]MDZ7341461.1 RNA polymerase factor sigma-54 [candidate division KSB1 bacterium]
MINVNLSQRMGLYMKQSPQQVLLSTLLQLPILSLEQRIKLELEQNPLLEEDLEMEEELDEELETEMKTEELELKQEEPENDGEWEEETKYDEDRDEIDWDTILNDENNYEIKPPKDESAETFDRPEVNQTTLPEYLLSQLHMTDLSEKELMIGEYIIWNINEVGYLAVSVEFIANNLGVAEAEVEKVLKIIQRFDPLGIAARDLQECLLIQLQESAEPNALAITVIKEHFDDFKNKRFEKIAKKLDISLEDFKEILNIITRLNPKPGEGYQNVYETSITPDVIVQKDGDEFKVILNDWNIPHLRINNSYKQLLLDKKKTSKKTKEFIKNRLESARWLINSIHQRRVTIVRVVEAIIKRQYEFFDKGTNYLKPMILKDVAEDIGMDISTVSRVTNGKYVQTDFGVFELKHFFSEKIKRQDGEDVSNKEVKNRIKEIIDAENPKRPLNDLKIVELLKKDGFDIARRTVAKYREQMNIPVSRLRRKI